MKAGTSDNNQCNYSFTTRSTAAQPRLTSLVHSTQVQFTTVGTLPVPSSSSSSNSHILMKAAALELSHFHPLYIRLSDNMSASFLHSTLHHRSWFTYETMTLHSKLRITHTLRALMKHDKREQDLSQRLNAS